MSFSNLKRQSGNLDEITQAIEKLNKPNTDFAEKDVNFWRPEVDKAGNGIATFRFLPAPPCDGDEGLPWAKYFAHGFQGAGGKWYIENCPTTFKGHECPVCKHNNGLWDTGIQANKDIVSKQKRKLNYVSNVYIVSDPKHPENEGKVRLFRYGKKIFDKITEAMKPPRNADGSLVDPDVVPINPFDLWKGANFKMKVRKVEGYANYDTSAFVTPAPLLKDDKELEAVYKSEFSLAEIVADAKFKTFEELQKILDRTLGLNGAAPSKTTVDHLKQGTAPAAPTSRVTKDDMDNVAPGDADYFKKLEALAEAE